MQRILPDFGAFKVLKPICLLSYQTLCRLVLFWLGCVPGVSERFVAVCG